MSGFLERLVAGSRRPPSIKPILGSVFTAPRDVGILEEVTSEALGETFQEAGQIEHRKDVVTETRRVDAAEEPAAAAPPREARRSPSSLEATRDERQSIPIVRQKAEFEPLVTRARQVASGEPQVPSAEVGVETEFVGALETEAPPQSVLAYRPLVVDNPGRASEVRPFKSSDTFISGSNRKTGQELPKRSEVATREPDEIQIHIGRIEVVAVPQQQAARAPAKSTRKSVSLDEYLKRGRRDG